MTETIYIPREISETLQDRAREKNEETGFLFYTPSTNKIVGMYDTAEGNAGGVEADERKHNLALSIARELGLKLIEYHIHSQGTLNLPNCERLRTEPTGRDLEAIAENLDINAEYKHLLVSVGRIRPLTANFIIKDYQPTEEDIDIMKDLTNYILEEENKL